MSSDPLLRYGCSRRDERATLVFSKLLDRYLEQAVPSLIADDFKRLATRAYELADAMEEASNG